MTKKDPGKAFADALNKARNLKENQRAYLEHAQEKMDVGPKEMAHILDTNFNTYKAWLYENNPLPGVVRVAIDCLLSKRRD